MIATIMDACEAAAAEPLRGITVDGQIQPNLFSIDASGVSSGPILDAAQALLGLLDSTQKAAISFPLDAQERRMWFNIHPNIFHHGLLLEDASAAHLLWRSHPTGRALQPSRTRPPRRSHAGRRWVGEHDPFFTVEQGQRTADAAGGRLRLFGGRATSFRTSGRQRSLRRSRS